MRWLPLPAAILGAILGAWMAASAARTVITSCRGLTLSWHLDGMAKYKGTDCAEGDSLMLFTGAPKARSE